MPFKWHPNDPPPQIEEHSKAKLDVLRRYLRAYFDTLGINPVRDEFRLDLVDGFAGGGTFLDDDGSTVLGTPLIMLEETRAAEERLNQERIKQLRFDCKMHFVDVERDHTNHLRRALDERGYLVDGQEIVVHTSPFEDVADQIIAEIQRRQPRAGRSIFLLDQTGFAQVQLSLVSRIFENLPMAEVILTFAKDHLLNRLSATKALIKAVAPLDISEQQMDIWTELKEGSNDNEWRALIQRGLRGHIRNRTGATYDTPFFIRPQQSRLALWFLHLSRHPTARDVMIQCHWSSSNTFEHYGSGGFDMLGWDALKSGQLPLFNFTEFDSIRMREELLDSMPAKLFTLSAEYPITVDAMRHILANETAARFSDYDDVVLQLAREREVEILNPDGKVRTRSLKRLGPTDRIAIPNMRLFPGISRLQ